MKNYRRISIVIYILLAIICVGHILISDQSGEDVVLPGKCFRGNDGYITEEGALCLNDEMELVGNDRKTPSLILNKGTYKVTVHYHSESDDNKIKLENGGILADSIILPKDSDCVTTEIVLDSDTQQFDCFISYCGKGELLVYDVTFSSEQFYSDNMFLALVVLTLFALGYLLWRINWDDAIGRKRLGVGVMLLGIALYSSYPYLNDNIWMADDIHYHLMRIEGIKDGLLEGQFPVLILPNAMKSNGYLNCMYPSLFLYLPAILRIGNVSLITSYKCLIVVLNILTAGITYYSVKELCKERTTAMIATVIYVLFPYRFSNIYHRGALGEVIAMAFFPLFFVALYHVLCGERKKWHLLVIAMTGFVQSHILSVWLACIICLIFGVLYFREILDEGRYKEILYSVIWIGLLNLWFLEPFLFFYGYENLWTTCLGMRKPGDYVIGFNNLFDTYRPDSYRCYSLGMALIICGIIAIIYFIVRKQLDKKEKWMLQLLIIGVVFAYCVTDCFDGWKRMEGTFAGYLFERIQFPWRLLTISGCIFSIVGPVCLEKALISVSLKRGIVGLLVIFSVTSAIKITGDSVDGSPYSMNTTGHVAKVIGVPLGKEGYECYPPEWRIEGSWNEMIIAHPSTSDDALVEMKDYKKQGTKVSYSYRTTATNQYIEVPLMAYMGYAAYNETGKQLEICREAETGNYIRIYLEPDGKWHSVFIFYEGFWHMKVANMISVATVVYLLYVRGIHRKDRNTNRKRKDYFVK